MKGTASFGRGSVGLAVIACTSVAYVASLRGVS